MITLGTIIFIVILLILIVPLVFLGISLATPGTREMIPPVISIPAMLGIGGLIAGSGYMLLPTGDDKGLNEQVNVSKGVSNVYAEVTNVARDVYTEGKNVARDVYTEGKNVAQQGAQWVQNIRNQQPMPVGNVQPDKSYQYENTGVGKRRDSESYVITDSVGGKVGKGEDVFTADLDDNNDNNNNNDNNDNKKEEYEDNVADSEEEEAADVVV